MIYLNGKKYKILNINLTNKLLNLRLILNDDNESNDLIRICTSCIYSIHGHTCWKCRFNHTLSGFEWNGFNIIIRINLYKIIKYDISNQFCRSY